MRALILIGLILLQVPVSSGCNKNKGKTCDSCSDPGTTKGCKPGYTCELFTDGLARCAPDSDQKCRGFGGILATEGNDPSGATGESSSSPCSRLCPQANGKDSEPAWMALVDLNADRLPDLVMLERADVTASVVFIHLAARNGSFLPRRAYATGGPPAMVLVRDLDGDGVLDLVTPSPDAGGVSFLSGVGDGTFLPARIFPAGGSPAAVAVEDLNGDGIPDLVLADPPARALTVLFALGGGEFGDAEQLPAGGRPLTVKIVDLDRDGALDLALECEGSPPEGAGEGEGPRETWYLLGKGNGTFSEVRACSCEGTDPHAVMVAQSAGTRPSSSSESEVGQ